ncbi:imidazole glycerol phosphate synthase subunit HisH [Clostridium sp. SYSU_GA19001]|uniref:imidazole glycerol phosphate synthase subunit HisH n=1 Tax=Clostridium caldaquaticum TaxID=2940653 RepID=UPI0020775C02|nr:imidazole glycerol phosphate synthase subunit HisH [Clostridium caldaquaticum]MCM8711449.1 imidazole glycerol phosphate synthase subunit HisH [Clostridium caldaquaticum]
MIAIIDYGMGNLRSVQKALEYLDVPSKITSDIEEIKNSSKIIIPGVGAFPDAMENMKKMGLDIVVKEEAKKGKGILGICLGMQLLFEESEEIIKCEGLGLFKGSIKKIKGNVKVPHMGWNNLIFEEDCRLLYGVKEGSYVYFVHSYYAEIGQEKILNAYTLYDRKIPGIVSKDNVFGMQFHPEKSGDCGIKMLKNFGEL